MSFTIRQVTNPSKKELADATTALAEAFNYSFFLSGLGGDKSLVEPILLAQLRTGLIGGEVYFAEQPGVGVIGASVWFGPGQKFLSSEAQRNAGWNQVMDKLAQEYQDWWTYLHARYDDLSEQSYGAGVKLASYHCQLLGVTPKYQGRGVGTALMECAEDKAKVIKVESLVDTSGEPDITIYKSMGYNIAGTGPIKQPSGKEFEMVFLVKHTEE